MLGILRYELELSSDGGGSYSGVSLPEPTATSYLTSLPDRSGKKKALSYVFRVRAVDKAGNAGAWAVGSPFKGGRRR